MNADFPVLFCVIREHEIPIGKGSGDTAISLFILNCSSASSRVCRNTEYYPRGRLFRLCVSRCRVKLEFSSLKKDANGYKCIGWYNPAAAGGDGRKNGETSSADGGRDPAALSRFKGDFFSGSIFMLSHPFRTQRYILPNAFGRCSDIPAPGSQCLNF
eukprot:Gb_38628 [translate_table: standard]